jgi:hypothetical protein
VVVIGLAHQVMLPLAALPLALAVAELPAALEEPEEAPEEVDDEEPPPLLLQADAASAATAQRRAAWASRRPPPLACTVFMTNLYLSVSGRFVKFSERLLLTVVAHSLR